MQLLDPGHPFFKPLWRRWATCVLPVVWGAAELWFGNPGWAIIFAATGVYAGWVLFRASD